MARTAVTKPTPEDHEWGEAVVVVDIATPSDGQKATGYNTVPTIPKKTHWNYFLRKFDRAVRYFIQRGLPDWDAAETYQLGDIIRYNGKFYVASAAPPTVGQAPTVNDGTSTRQWEPWLESNYGTAHTATTDAPVKQWHTQNAVPTSQIDRLGFFGGVNVAQWLETWRGDETQVTTGTSWFEKTAQRWHANVVAGGAAAVSMNTAALQDPSRVAGIQIGTGASDQAEITSETQASFTTFDVIAAEWSEKHPATITLCRIAQGFASLFAGHQYADSDGFIGAVFAKGNGDANWQCITGDGAARTTVNSGVAVDVTGNAAHRFRIEWLGSTKSDDGVSQVRFYIDGALVATTTTHLPTTGDCDLFFGMKRDTGASARSMRVYPVRFSAQGEAG